MTNDTEDVYCTLLMSDSYLPGAAVLAHSLRDAGTKKKIAVIVTLDSLLYNTITKLKSIFDYVIPVDKIANPNLSNLARLDRLDLRFAFTKIALWQQQQFRRIVYIDADVVAHRAPDELFNLEHSFAAAPDIGWPDIFNSGVMMLTPNEGDYRALHTLAASGTSFDGADQGLLNEYFGEGSWHRLSFTYNCTPSSSYQYEPAYRHFRSNIKMTHFIGKEKPWQQGRNGMNSATSGVYRELVGKWWSVYDRHYGTVSSALGGSSAADHHVQQFVAGENMSNGLTKAQATSTELPLMEPNDALETLQTQPPLGSEQRPFNPPQMSWDATRSAPPTQTKAEAEAFPRQRYEMSASKGLFHAPAYPEPPRDMYYQVPPRPEPADKPAPIFPWEHQAKKPTRVFADYRSALTSPSTGSGSTATPENPIAPNNDLDSFTRTNAWDNNPTIDQYVRAVREQQSKRGGAQAVHHDERDKDLSDVSVSSATSPKSKKRRAPIQESLIVTDFPTEVERPSLPVTPAPIKRPSFWGEERDEQGELPAAEGVPHQSEWNPHEKLEELRRSSVAAAEELPKQASMREMSLRSLPETSSEMPGQASEADSTMESSTRGGSTGGS